MIRIFSINPAEKCTLLASTTKDEIAFKYGSFHGKPKLLQWAPVVCGFYKPRKKQTDFASCGQNPVFSASKLDTDDVLHRLLKKSCEFLPLTMPLWDPLLIHPTKVVECVDRARSTIKFMPGDVWVFSRDNLLCGQVCKIAEMPWVTIIASDSDLPPEEDFYQWYHKQGYTGLDFKLLWQSDE